MKTFKLSPFFPDIGQRHLNQEREQNPMAGKYRPLPPKDRTHHLNSDVNFDTLAAKFQRKVYGGLKGEIRLAVLNRDLAEFCPRAMAPDQPLSILDAGCGAAPFSLDFMERGHDLTLCDISEKMLDMARERAADRCREWEVAMPSFHHGAVQDLTFDAPFDLVLCHAVLEWVAEPRALLACLARRVKPGGFLSLTFYNRHGMIFKNLLRANYKKIKNKAFHGWPGSLTPAHPRTTEEVLEWIGEIPGHPLSPVCHSGMRVFHDYNLDPGMREKEPETVKELELQFSRQRPYRDLGRYQHLILSKRS